MNPKTLVGGRVRDYLRGQGWQVEKPDATGRRSLVLASLGITTVLDVGANVGRYGRTLRESGYRGRLVSFEPLTKPQAVLGAAAAADPLWDTMQVAVSDEDGTAEINVASADVWSSLLPTHEDSSTEHARTTATETVRTAQLDSLDVLDGTPTWLKLDVQGFELHALRGAERSLPRIAGVECEMVLETFYEGQASVRDVIDFLYDHGFRLVAVDNGHVRPSTGRAMWIDGLFVRD